jgi:hypothetical protein
MVEQPDWIGRRRDRPRRPSRLEEYLLRAPEPAADGAEVAAELARTRERLAELETRLAATEEELHAAHAADARVLFDDPPDERPPRPVRALARRYEPGPTYWLCRCEGFRVATASRTLGTVTGVRYGARVDRPDLLELRTSLGQRRLLPVDAVERIDGRAREIVLRTDDGGREKRWRFL